MKLPRRQFLRLAAGAAALPAVSRIARAQSYPSRPITIIVPYAAGGPTDTVGRVMAERMRDLLGQPVVVENVTGAAGSIGTGRAARAAPDGYTLSLGDVSTHVVNGAVRSLQYDVLNDFEPVCLLAISPLLIVGRKTMPATNLQELIAWLKANPDRASQGVAGASSQLAGFYFQTTTATRFQVVPYRGAAPAVQDMVAGHIDLMFPPASVALASETSPPKAISASGRGRCRTPGSVARHLGASLSVAAGALDSRLYLGRQHRHHIAPVGSAVVGAARSAIHHRKSTGGWHQHRHRGGRARAGRRPYASFRQCIKRNQCDALR